MGRATASQVTDGFTRTETRQTTDGRKYTVTRENPVNRLKSQLQEQNLRVLEMAGVFDTDTEVTEQACTAAVECLAEQEKSADRLELLKSVLQPRPRDIRAVVSWLYQTETHSYHSDAW